MMFSSKMMRKEIENNRKNGAKDFHRNRKGKCILNQTKLQKYLEQLKE